jgi:Glycosyl transferase family 2
MPLITLSMPVFHRPLRTQRMIRAILGQTMPNWEAFVIGDCCPYFSNHDDLLSDPRFWAWNQHRNGGSWGYQITNLSIQHATGKYFMFLGSDDLIALDHLENYLSEIDGTDYDFVYFNSMVLGKKARYRIQYGHIGDNALIIKTEFLKRMPPRKPDYGHDFKLITNMIAAGARFKKSHKEPTYYIMTSPANRIDPENID